MRALVIIGLILVAALAGRYMVENANDANQGGQGGVGGSSQTTDVTLQNRGTLHKVLQEHTITGSLYLQQLYDGKDTTETEQKVQRNSTDFFAIMDKASDRPTIALEKHWKQHLDDYKAYTLALKDENQTKADEVERRLEEHAIAFAEAVESLLPGTSSDHVASAMNQHMRLTIAVITAHAENDTSEKLNESAKASAQAASFAEALIPNND